jgi:hypothetical protein
MPKEKPDYKILFPAYIAKPSAFVMPTVLIAANRNHANNTCTISM